MVTESRFEAAAGVRVVTLDDDAIVFNPFSWETHLLNPAAALVLDVVATSPCTETGVCAVLLELLDEQERPRALHHARRLLRELVELRLLNERAVDSDAGC